MKITVEMVREFNRALSSLGCSFCLEYDDRTNNPECTIIPVSMLFVDSSIINCTKEFYQLLEGFFTKKGIELSYNNTANIFWSKNGFDK